VLELFPETAAIDDGELVLGGVRASVLAQEHGTPLVVFCEETLRRQAQAYRAAAPEAQIVFGTKAFPNLALLELFAEEGLGADVSTLGELEYALRAGLTGERLVVHGNNKSDEELLAAAESGGLVVLDALERHIRRPDIKKGIGRARVTVARLADAARVDQRALRPEVDRGARRNDGAL